MLNVKLIGFCVIVVAIALVFGANDGGTNEAGNAAKTGNLSAVVSKNEARYCPSETSINKKDCGEASFAHYHTCCRDGEKECCFALQIWVYVVLAVIVLAIIISTIVGIICCCCKK